jgi:murein DD-endopeptidase MepM/ murein hydrolase activator NlpD
MGNYFPFGPLPYTGSNRRLTSNSAELVGGPSGLVNVRAYDQEREDRLIRIRAHQRGRGRRQEFGTGDEAPLMVNPIPGGGLRLKWGKGHFRARRVRKDGSVYEHEGVDIMAEPGTEVLAPVDGIVGEPYDPYRSDPKKSKKFTAIPIETADGTKVNVLYVTADSRLKRGDKVVAGTTVIGTVQNQKDMYRDIKNHVHVEVKKGNRAIDPTWAIYGRR